MKASAAPALVLVAMCACSGTDPHVGGAVLGDGTLAVTRGALTTRLLLTGAIAAVDSEPLTVPRTETWTQSVRWMVDDGTAVSAGERVLEFDNATFIRQLEEHKLAATAAGNELSRQIVDNEQGAAEKRFAVERDRIALAKARLQAEVSAESYPRRTYQEKQLELRRAELAFEKANDELREHEKTAALARKVKQIAYDKALREIREVRRVIDSLVLTAPRDGMFLVAKNDREGRNVQVGDTVWPGMTVAEIPDLSRLRVEASLSDVDDGRVTVGMAARCLLDTYPERTLTGRVTSLSPVAQEPESDSLRRAFRVSIELEHSDASIMRPGMSVKVEIDDGAPLQGLLAPRAALDLATSRAYPADGAAIAVTLGPCDAHHCLIASGLHEGARLRRRSP